MSLLHFLVIASALLQLIGTALIVYGLRFTSDMGAWYGRAGKEIPYSGIVREHAWAITVGPWLLLLGLALQVITAVGG